MRKAFIKLIVISLMLVFLGGTGFYVTQSGRIFYKACDFHLKHREAWAAVAHQAIVNNFPYSPFAAISDAILYAISNSENQARRISGAYPSAVLTTEQPPFVDNYISSGLLFYLILGIIGSLQRLSGWIGLKGRTLIFRVLWSSAIAAFYWVSWKVLCTGDPTFSAWREILSNMRLDAAPNEMFLLITMAISALILLMCGFSTLRLLFSFRSLPPRAAEPPPLAEKEGK